jgi:predicted NBD/HSP70 family sugar kinase
MTEPTSRPVRAARSPVRAGGLFGADLGGTKLRAAIADASGTILDELVETTVRGSGEKIVAQVGAALATLAGRAGVPPGFVRAAGIGLPLAVDPRSGESWSFHNVPGLGGFGLADAFRDALGVPVALDNDGNCAALGEGRAGAAIGVADFAVIVIGTGIGSGIVAGGRLLRGAHGGAGEIAFLPLGTDPWDERNRALGAYETAVAGPAIRARLEAAMQAGPGAGRGPAEPTTRATGAALADIATAAAMGDALAVRLLDEEARYVALGIAAIAAVTDPEVVVLSGGVGAVGALLEPVRTHVAVLTARPPRVVTGLLGERAPLVGAVGLASDLAGPA